MFPHALGCIARWADTLDNSYTNCGKSNVKYWPTEYKDKVRLSIEEMREEADRMERILNESTD